MEWGGGITKGFALCTLQADDSERLAPIRKYDHNSERLALRAPNPNLLWRRILWMNIHHHPTDAVFIQYFHPSGAATRESLTSFANRESTCFKRGFRGLGFATFASAMSRALRPLADRLLRSWTAFSIHSPSTVSNSRACSSLTNVGSPAMMQSPSWMEWNSRMVLPEESDCVVGDMELMAVPKRKVTPSRKGKRNGGKFLKAVPVIAKCKACGRVKLPQFYCCDGQVKS